MQQFRKGYNDSSVPRGKDPGIPTVSKNHAPPHLCSYIARLHVTLLELLRHEFSWISRYPKHACCIPITCPEKTKQYFVDKQVWKWTDHVIFFLGSTLRQTIMKHPQIWKEATQVLNLGWVLYLLLLLLMGSLPFQGSIFRSCRSPLQGVPPSDACIVRIGLCLKSQNPW